MRKAFSSIRNFALKALAVAALAAGLQGGVSAFAQGGKVTLSGTVTDENNLPMMAVGVLEKGTTNGVITDLDGHYSISVPKGATVEFNSLGYLVASFVADESKTLNVKMELDQLSIEETVVVGYGVQRKSDVTGAISQVKSEDIANRTIASPEQALQGKMSGVQTFSGSARPGATPSVRIRGISSNYSSDPLYVVDGRISKSGIAGIDPNDIESMEILKDAASAAIYGAEAGNGVVLITTRKGKGDGKITYSYQLSSQSLGKTPKVMNSEQFIQYYLERGRINITDVYANWDFKTNTDWLDYSYENSLMQHHNITFSGGNDRGSLYVSGSYLDNNGMFKGDADVYERLTGMVNGTWKFKPWLDIQTNNQVEYYRARSVSEGSEYGSAVAAALQLDPLTPPTYTEENLPDFMRTYLNSGLSLLMDEQGNYYSASQFTLSENVNPMVQRDRTFSQSKGFNINGATALNFRPFRDLTITSRLGYRLSASDSYSYNNDYYLSNFAHNDFMSVNASTSDSIYYQWENFANYMKQIGKHNITAMVGMSYSQSRSYSTSAGVSGSKNGEEVDFGLTQDNPLFYYIAYATPTAIKSVGGGMESYGRKLSYFGRVGWSYQNRYHLQASLRADAADLSVLPKPMRWGYFPSVSAGWTLSEEPFFEGAKAIFPYVKIRASWGQNGSVSNLGGYAYSNDITGTGNYPTGKQTASGSWEYIQGYAPSSTGNDELKWETSEQIDLGLDMRFLRDRLAVGVDFYHKMTKDLLVSGVTPSTVVGVSASPMNAGNITNQGFEFEVKWRDQIGDFNYSVNANFSTLKNRVTYLHPSIKDGLAGVGVRNYGTITRFEKGYPAWHFYGYDFTGINPENGDAMFKDYDGIDGMTDGDKIDLGSGIPTYNFGLTLTAGWKGIDAVVFLTGAGGNKIFNALNNVDYTCNRLTYFTEDRWTPSHTNGTMPAANASNWTQYLTSSAVVFDGSYVKIKQIQLGYTLPQSLTRKVKIDNLRIYSSLDDYFTFTKYIGFDPEVTGGSGSSAGVDKGSYPTSKKVVFGVNVSF